MTDGLLEIIGLCYLCRRMDLMEDVDLSILQSQLIFKLVYEPPT